MPDPSVAILVAGGFVVGALLSRWMWTRSRLGRSAPPAADAYVEDVRDRPEDGPGRPGEPDGHERPGIGPGLSAPATNGHVDGGAEPAHPLLAATSAENGAAGAVEPEPGDVQEIYADEATVDRVALVMEFSRLVREGDRAGETED